MSFEPTGFAGESEPPRGPASCVANADARADERLPVNTQLQLCWDDRKIGQRQVRARAIDVNKLGIQVVSERAIPSGTVVYVYTANFTPIGRACVRHCTTKGMDYRLGLYMPDRFLQDL